MTIEKKGNGYRVRLQYKGKRYTVYFDHKPTQAEAMQAITEKIADAGVMNSATTFRHCATSYINDRSATISPTTLREYTGMVRNLPTRLLDAKITEVDQILVQSVVNELAVTRSPKTVRNFHGFISSVLKMYSPHVVLNTTLPAKQKSEAYIPTDDDIKKIIEASKGTNYEYAIALACYGLRRSEVLGLDIATDLEGDILHINKALVMDKDKNWIIKPYNKTTESRRDIRISSDLADKLRARGYVYKGYPNQIGDWLVATEKKLGIKHFSLHKLRHYFCSSAHALNIPDAYIMAAGGWRSDYVLKSTYRHVFENEADMANQAIRDHLNSILNC